MLRIARTVPLVVALLLLSAFLPACSPADTAAPPPEADATAVETTAEETGPVHVAFDPASFGSSTQIDNPWLPMQPGTQWIFEGIAFEEGEETPHRIEFTMTDLVKQVDGVRTAVAWVIDISDGEVVEKELAFYAQDDEGNVWYFGEHPEEFEDGEFIDAPTWLAGQEGARAGIKMFAMPENGPPSYFQGWGPEVEWTDYGQMDQMSTATCVAVDCYDGVLVIAESSLDEEGTFQLKYYAPGVGNVRVGWKGDDSAYEELELVALNRLDEAALAAIRDEALALEAHAYEVNDVYAQTPPLERP